MEGAGRGKGIQMLISSVVCGFEMKRRKALNGFKEGDVEEIPTVSTLCPCFEWLFV